ncbi:MAG: FecR family protein, partial [Lachnospiraceae bacterium]|nr:FecR family protein [Lachnospiraceae bacterium]
AESAAWLLLEEDRAVELGENSALHIDRQSKGFVLTLTAGEVTARIDKPLSDGEEFTVKAGNLALAVRGTIFTVRIDGAIVTVSVERGEVAVIDSSGNELTTIGEDESVSFDTSAGNAVVAAPAQSSNDNYEVGDIVGFGGYEWRVLEVSDGKALLLSEYVLELRPYNGEWRDDLTFDENIAALSTTWADCDLRAYLNGEFYDSLGADIKARIVETQVVNDDNPEYGTPGGADTNDKIFLLSIDEAEAYFSDDTARIAYDSSGAASWWWLRSPGYGSRYAALVGRGGDVDVNGIYGIYIGYGGVRPALWLNL